MTILQEILKWAQGLPTWQQDAISRLITKGTLDAADTEDIYALLKSAHGIADPKGRVAKPVDLASVPSLSNASSLVQVTCIRDLQHVNALAEKQSLPIAPSGLTVIYGGNGAGKSGYSRVLKRACKARDQSELVHPNAAHASGKSGKATAVFDLLINGVASSVTWIDKQAAPDVLGTIAIFDSRCARAYIDEQDDFFVRTLRFGRVGGIGKGIQSTEGHGGSRIFQINSEHASICKSVGHQYCSWQVA